MMFPCGFFPSTLTHGIMIPHFQKKKNMEKYIITFTLALVLELAFRVACSSSYWGGKEIGESQIVVPGAEDEKSQTVNST